MANEIEQRRVARRWRAALVTLTAAASLILPARARGQGAPGINAAGAPIWAGGELDNYLRYLQTTSLVDPSLAWTLRAFSPSDALRASDTRGENPWSARIRDDRARTTSRFVLLPAELGLRMNSGYPFGGNDGPLWAGRGVTTSLQGGIQIKAGPLTVVLAPMLFRAENAAFALKPTGLPGRGRFNDPYFPSSIDRPQRFGADAYQRVSWGESTVRLDAWRITTGVTTANQWWGPATVFPYLLSNNAAGLPSAFFGTRSAIPVGIGKVQARVIYGLAQQSPFSPVQGSATFVNADQPGTVRFAAGLITTFQPSGIPSLELGAARYFDQAWTGRVGRAQLRAPFQGLVRRSVRRGTPAAGEADPLKNQLASVFARWTAPKSGFELYTEYSHEDFNEDTRDLVLEPDHSRAALLGFRKAFTSGPDRLDGLRVEVFDATAPSLGRNREEGLLYAHVLLRQGHTQEGQLLGANAGVGSMSGTVLAWDRYSPAGRTTWYLQRTTQSPLVTPGAPFGLAATITGAAGVDRTMFLAKWDVTAGVAAAFEGHGAGRRGFNLALTVLLRSRARPFGRAG